MAEAAPELAGEDLPGLPLHRLGAYLAQHVPEIGDAPLRASLISGGRSNLTYLLGDSAGRRWVLRRPPLGTVLETAHDMAREFRLIDALNQTRVPVPRALHLSAADGQDLLGAPFYVMSFADGVVMRDREQLASVRDPHGLARSLMQCLASLHEVIPEEVGLSDLGRPDGYLDRQLGRWLRQVGAIESPLEDQFAQMASVLRGGCPTTQRTRLVHGDYRLDNVVVGAENEIVAVLDWEMATRGDPLADIASTLVWWDGMRGMDSPIAAHPGDLPGFPDRHVLVDAYAEVSDLDLSDLDWYLGFAFYKIAAIFEGIRHRHAEGMTLGEGFGEIGPLVPHLLDSARASLSGSHS